MVRVFSPRKSILITPASSITLPSIWVSHKWESLEVATGIRSVRSCGAMMMPAAWIPVLRTEPSSRSASCSTLPAGVSTCLYMSRSFFTLSSSSFPNPSFSSSDFSPSFAFIGACNTRFNSIPGLSGTSLASALDSARGRSITRATSLILIFAAMVP